nr:MAG TPA: hypothetical protein [Caudoviricetes sp.]
MGRCDWRVFIGFFELKRKNMHQNTFDFDTQPLPILQHLRRIIRNNGGGWKIAVRKYRARIKKK